MIKEIKKVPKAFLILTLTPLLIFAVIAFKISSSPRSYVYVKIKVSQGLWWVNSAKPTLWMANSIHKGDIEKNLLGQPIAEVSSVTHYPYLNENLPYEDQYDVYITLKLAADSNTSSGKITFKRSTLSVGAPIELDLPSSQVTGTVMQIQSEPFENKYTEKTIFLTKRLAYPWEFNAIKVGETYNNGEAVVFKIIDKEEKPTATLSPDSFGNLSGTSTEPTRYITVKAKVLAKEKGAQFYFGEEKVLKAGELLSVTTPSYKFEDFLVSRVENTN